MAKKASPPQRIGTATKAFTYAGNKYAVGDAFPRHGEDVPMLTVSGMVANQSLTLDRIPGPGQKLGQGYKNPDAIRREVNAEPKSAALTE